MQKFFSTSTTTTIVDERCHVGLPRDVWDTIADFIPEKDLKKLYAVNSALLHRAFKLRYQSIHVTKWADISTCQLLDHLEDPFRASFVRHVGVQFEGLQQHGIQDRPGISPMNLSPTTMLLAKAQRYANNGFSLISSLLSSSDRLIPSLELTMALLVQVMPLLQNVHSFSFNCWDLPLNLNISPILEAAWSSFGSKLTSFVFNGNIDSYIFLMDSMNGKPSLPSLTTLELDTTLNIRRNERDIAHEHQVLRDFVVPLVKTLAPQLERFTLFFFPNADLSEFFNDVSKNVFKNLKYLRLRMPYNRTFNDTSGLLRFLSPTTLPRVDNLNLRLNPAGVALDRSNEIPLTQLLMELANYTPATFTKLHTLELFPTHFPEGRDVLYTAISRSCDTLESVCVRDRSLQPEEFIDLVRKLMSCSKLTALRINLSKLDIGVIDLLANSFPKLIRLTLALDESRNLDEPSISPTLEQDLATRDYSSWALRDVGFFRAGSHVDRCLMEAFARRVPSVKSFWGNGHMLNSEVEIRTRSTRTPPAQASIGACLKRLLPCTSSRGLQD
ncbi:hypothetical protein AN958_09679 [Leucoagaricus sp. SymC.cos]|nr:hypothetical protein AN958_09679 [Leucoagaricus sp. SymC.cos]